MIEPSRPGPRFPERAAGPHAESHLPKEIYSFAQIQHLVRVEFRRAQRYGYPLVVLEIGVDRLEHLRDVFGYELKEAVLARVLDLVVAQTRGSDLVGRLPDDRLLVLVPHVEAEGARVLARRLIGAARTLELVHEGRTLELTLSIGASWTVAGQTLFFDTLLEAAAAARADAAQAGGDRFVSRPPGEHPGP